MATFTTIINGAYRLLGVVSPTTTQSTNGLEAIQQLIDEWNADGTRIYTLSVVNVATSNPQDYSLGVGGTVTTVWSPKLERCWVRRGTADAEVPVIDASEYAASPLHQTSTNGQPTGVYYTAQYPTASALFVPYGPQGDRVYFQIWSPLTVPAAAGDTFTFPPAYAKALKFNLAVDLSPEFAGSALGADMERIERTALRSLNIIKSMNARQPRKIRLDAGLRRRAPMYDVLAGDP